MWTGWGEGEGWGQRGGGELRQSKKKCTLKKFKNLGNNQSNPIKYIAWVPMSHPLGTIVAYDKNVGYICRGYACLGYPCRAFRYSYSGRSPALGTTGKFWRTFIENGTLGQVQDYI